MAVIFCDAAIDKSTLNSIVSERLSASKQRAKKHKTNGKPDKLEHDIDGNYIKHLLKQSGYRCPLTKRNFVFIAGHPFNFSLDRITNEKGYIPGNVWVVSTWANKAKSDLTEEEFKEYCKLVTEAT